MLLIAQSQISECPDLIERMKKQHECYTASLMLYIDSLASPRTINAPFDVYIREGIGDGIHRSSDGTMKETNQEETVQGKASRERDPNITAPTLYKIPRLLLCFTSPR